MNLPAKNWNHNVKQWTDINVLVVIKGILILQLKEIVKLLQQTAHYGMVLEFSVHFAEHNIFCKMEHVSWELRIVKMIEILKEFVKNVNKDFKQLMREHFANRISEWANRKKLNTLEN